MSAQAGSQRSSTMTLNGQVYHVLHDDKHIKALTKVGLINTSTPASQAMQEVYAAWLLPQESKFEGDKGRNLCIADQYSADRWLLYPLHVYAALAKGAPVENDRLDDFFFQKIIQGQFLPITPSTRSVLITTEPQKGTTSRDFFEKLKAAYSQREGRFSQLVFGQILADLNSQGVSVIPPQLTQSGFCRSLDGQLQFITRGMLDHVIFMPNTESRIPMRMNVQLTEVYEVDPTTGKVAPFPSALEIRGADAELFQQMLLKDEGKKEFARLLRDPSRVYTHDQFILLMKETRMALFQDAISIQMRLNNLCTILDLMIKCHQEVIDSNKYPTVDEQRWAVEELSNRIHDLRTLTANLAIRHKASTPHFEIFYQHILAPAMEMRFERLDKQLGVSTQLTTPIHPSSAVTSRTATVLAPSSASQDQDAKSSSSGSASSSPTPSA